MNKSHRDNRGFGVVALLLALLVLAALAATGWYIWQKQHVQVKSSQSNSSTQSSSGPTSDPYAGWKEAISNRAKFTIKYPSDWSYNSTVGDKDNVEHITLSDNRFTIKIDSFLVKDSTTDVNPPSTCADCKQTLNSVPFTLAKFGQVKLDTVTYSLDNGSGNALIIRTNSDIYLIPSPDASNTYTSFRGISKLNSLQEYQNETTTQFTNNPGYTTALKILKSISY